MTRAIGDVEMKAHGLIAEPEVSVSRITADDDFMVSGAFIWAASFDSQLAELDSCL